MYSYLQAYMTNKIHHCVYLQNNSIQGCNCCNQVQFRARSFFLKGLPFFLFFFYLLMPIIKSYARFLSLVTSSFTFFLNIPFSADAWLRFHYLFFFIFSSRFSSRFRDYAEMRCEGHVVVMIIN